MPGLLDYLKKDTTKGAIGGVLGMALAGFNPALGLLAGPVIGGAMRESRGRHEKQELENEMMRRQLDAPGAYAEQFIPAGARGNPVSGDMLSAPDPGQFTEEEWAAYQDALQMGPLMDVAPGATVQAITDDKRDPADVSMMKFLGLEGTEGFAEMYRIKNQMDPRQQLQLTESLLAIEELRYEMAKTRRSDMEATELAELTAVKGLETMLNMGELSRSLADTPLVTGSGVRPFMRAGMQLARYFGELTGIGEWDDFAQALQDSDTFDKEVANVMISAMAQTDSSGVSVNNQAMQNLVRAGVPNGEMSPGTIEIMTRAMLKLQHDQMKIKGQKIPPNVEMRMNAYMDTPQIFRFISEAEADAAIRTGQVPAGSGIQIGDGRPVIWDGSFDGE